LLINEKGPICNNQWVVKYNHIEELVGEEATGALDTSDNDSDLDLDLTYSRTIIIKLNMEAIGHLPEVQHNVEKTMET
jgi:hypothetical protein